MAKLFSPKQKPVPEPTPPPPMPDAESPAVREAKRRATEMAMQRAGRASTILGGSNDAGSGDSYSGSKLG
jgi:hypothetical protein